jgi:hypothetical protein
VNAILVAVAVVLAAMSAGVQAQACPPVDPAEQKVRELECRNAGGEWARFGVRDHLCGIYSCAARTKDAGKPCRNRSECEHLCVTALPPRIGAEVVGHCTAVRTSFGCFTHVDGGKIAGRVCVD